VQINLVKASLTQLAIQKFLVQHTASSTMPFGSRNQNKRNRDARSAKEAEKQRARDEEIEQKKAKDALEAERQQFIAQNSTLPDEARLTKAVKFSMEEAKKPAKIRVPDKEILELFTVKKTAFYATKGATANNLEKATRSMFYDRDAASLSGGAATIESDPLHRVKWADFFDSENQKLRLQHAEETRLCKVLEERKENVKQCEAILTAAQERKKLNVQEAKQKKAADAGVQDATIALAAARYSQSAALQELCDACGKDESMGADLLINEAIPAPMAKGRPAVFSEATFAACIAEFRKIQTGIKDGVSQDFLVKMLLKKRQELQARSGEVLAAPSKSCLADAVRRLDTETCPGSSQPDSRARALEEYRNAFTNGGMWFGLDKLKILPALQFNIDEVGIWLNARDGKPVVLHFQKGVLAEAVKRNLSPRQVLLFFQL
jgi:hypothetical protein